MQSSCENKRIWIFCSLVLLLGFAFGFVFPELLDRTTLLGTAGIWIYSFLPMLCMFITRALTKEGFNELGISSPIGKGFQYSLIGWYGTFIVMIAGQLLFFVFNRNMLDTSGDLSGTWSIYKAGLICFPIILDAFFLLGEECGWRGYLLPKLAVRYGVIPATLFVGVIWAVWHIPLVIVAVHGFDVPSFSIMTSANTLQSTLLYYFPLCISLSMIYSYLTLKSKSALPAAAAHACYNVYITESLTFVRQDLFDSVSIHFNNPNYYSILLFFLIGILCMVLLRKEEKNGSLYLLKSEEKELL